MGLHSIFDRTTPLDGAADDKSKAVGAPLRDMRALNITRATRKSLFETAAQVLESTLGLVAMDGGLLGLSEQLEQLQGLRGEEFDLRRWFDARHQGAAPARNQQGPRPGMPAAEAELIIELYQNLEAPYGAVAMEAEVTKSARRRCVGAPYVHAVAVNA